MSVVTYPPDYVTVQSPPRQLAGRTLAGGRAPWRLVCEATSGLSAGSLLGPASPHLKSTSARNSARQKTLSPFQSCSSWLSDLCEGPSSPNQGT